VTAEGQAVRSELAAFLRARREAILQRWQQAVRHRPATQGLPMDRLIDHLPDLLDAIAATHEEYVADERARLATEAAERHAVERLVDGLDLQDVVVELAVLRDAILDEWDSAGMPARANELRFLSRALDRAITASVERYIATRDRTLRALDRISTAALESRRLDDLLNGLLGVLAETTPAVDTGVVLLRDGDDLVVRAAVGFDEDDLIGERVRIGDGFAGRVAAERRPRQVGPAEIAELAVSTRPSVRRLRCLYAVPLIESGAVVGVAHIGSFTAPDFSEQDKRLFEAMAARAASGIAQHQLREAAEARAAEIAAVVESIPEAVLVGDERGIRTANTAALALLGIGSVGEINDDRRRFGERFLMRRAGSGDPLPEEDRPFRRALRGDKVRDELVLRNLRTGRDVRLAVSAAPVVSEGGRAGVVMVATDVTAQRRLEAERERLFLEAQQAVADRRHALAVVSHDLRNPLNTVRVSAALLRAPELGDDTRAKAVDAVERAVSRMNRMIADLLDFSSIQAGRLSVEPAPTDTRALVEEALETVRPLAGERGLRLEADVRADIVRADRDRLLQALGNLLSNAIKATAKGAVGVRAEAREDGVRFEVWDTGAGMPPEVRDRLFEPYWRGERATYRGTGLGLAITRGIVEAHGGAIEVDSTLDQGTTFTFTLPR
jgi:signal transduction histidine kinase